MSFFRITCAACGARDMRKLLSSDGFSFKENWTPSRGYLNICKACGHIRLGYL